jgi:subtilisin family serine protease
MIGLLLGAGLATVLVATASATLGAAPAAAAPSTEGIVRLAAADRAIADRYIVTFKDTPAVRSSTGTVKAARDLAARNGGKVHRTFTSTLRGFSVKMTAKQARRLAADPRVASVEQDATVRIADAQSGAPWGLDRLDQRALPLDGSYTFATPASNVSAYILDTGIRTTHAEFGGRARSGWDFVDNDADANDCNGHGTHVAGTVGGATYGVAKGVTLHALRVLNCQGSGSISGIIAGVEWVTQHAVKPAVANMSIGAKPSAALDAAVRRSIASGITYGVAAGNENTDACKSSPARTAEAITVGATTPTDARATFSNWGTCVDLFAPGLGVKSAWHTGDNATDTINGTSMATPHVVGAAALYLATHPTATPQQVRTALVTSATANIVTAAGAGSPPALLSTLAAAAPSVPDVLPVPVPVPVPVPTAPAKYFENTTDQAIADDGDWTVSPISVTGVSGKATITVKVGVDIKHSFRGDLAVELVAPNGTAHKLKSSSRRDSANNVTATYTVKASTLAAAGTWRLRVRDVYKHDTGYIDSWSLQF